MKSLENVICLEEVDHWDPIKYILDPDFLVPSFLSQFPTHDPCKGDTSYYMPRQNTTKGTSAETVMDLWNYKPDKLYCI